MYKNIENTTNQKMFPIKICQESWPATRHTERKELGRKAHDLCASLLKTRVPQTRHHGSKVAISWRTFWYTIISHAVFWEVILRVTHSYHTGHHKKMMVRSAKCWFCQLWERLSSTQLGKSKISDTKIIWSSFSTGHLKKLWVISS